MSLASPLHSLPKLSRLWPVALLAGCATAAPPTVGPGHGRAAVAHAAAAASAPADAASAPARPDPTAPKPFAEVIKGARVDDGFIPVWRKDDKVWLELLPDRIGKPMHLAANITSSVGERGLYGGQMGRDGLVEFRLVGRTLQLRALNLAFRADGDAAVARALRDSFSESLLGATPVASAPHPDRKSVLVDASFLLGDLLGYSTAVEQAFRLPYGLDRGNSRIESVRVGERGTSLLTELHFATARIPAAPAGPLPPTAIRPTLPQTLPDPRSFFVGVRVNFTALPEQPMQARPADPRIGHFVESFVDLSSDFKANPRVHHVVRWRLEKKDPAAALSEPVKPITYWMDRNIPARYRDAVRAGILEWNKAFERIGFKDAVVARQQPDDAEFDTLDAEHASIRWFTGADVGFARGPSHTDPRSGEILDADIALSDAFSRGARRFIAEDSGVAPAAGTPGTHDHGIDGEHAYCTFSAEAAQEMAFALDLLEARGELEPDSPEAEAFVQAYIKETVMHEVGHTLGLRHNFRASTTVSNAQLQDPGFTGANGISGSVMDYVGFNVPLSGEGRGAPVNTTLGPYDYWAIEYAYRPFDAAAEAAGLARIAARSTEPALAYADDVDAGGFGSSAGLDPRDNRFDLGDDPLAWARKRLALSRELWQRVQARGPKAGDDPMRLRRSLLSGFRQVSRLPEMVAKYVGGMYTERDLPGSGGRPAYRPVEPARQREALDFLTSSLFSIDSFRFAPEFLASMGTDAIEWRRPGPVSVPAAVLGLQVQAMDRLLAPGTAQRLLELPYYLPAGERRSAISLDEVLGTLQRAVWSELDSGREIDPLRRNLQREHLRRVQLILTRNVAGLPADALSLVRLHAGNLHAGLRKQAARRDLSVETRAHLQDSLGALGEALRATMLRAE